MEALDLEEVKVMAAKSDFEELKKSIVWADIVRELSAWREGFEIERAGIVEKVASENLSTATVLLHMGDINGRIKTVDYILSLPDVLMEMIEMEKETKSDEQLTEGDNHE
ncbi:MAG: hypothetical protein KAJ19_29470 [Gammaproteobacteria bacterium]|nr:hypothetical protein [Gammaproteobacteria bacterium]